MKPDGPVARRADYEVISVPHVVAKVLVATFHYARGAANTSVHAHALVRKADGVAVGACLWMPPTRRAAEYAANLFGDRGRWREVLCLSRCVVIPGEPKNATGLMLAASVRRVKLDPRWSFAVTFADDWRGHAGTIYRATGWTEAGKTEAKPTWLDADGALVAQRAGYSNNRTGDEMVALGCTMIGRFTETRFVLGLR